MSAQGPVQAALDAAIERFVARNPRSSELYIAATKSMPGGNTRTLLYTKPFPVLLKYGRGYEVTSEDGHT
jgi:glutamate-1-semialdehyde 2,1-aminomutase